MTLSDKTPSDLAAASDKRRIYPLMGIMLLGFLCIGLSLPVLPVYIHFELGLGAGWVGIVAGSHFVVAIVSRPIAGRTADRFGGKPAVAMGLVLGSLGGLMMLISIQFAAMPIVAVLLLLLARLCLGASESFLITGAIGWGIGMVAPQRRSFVISWLGSAMFLAYAAVMPLGSITYANWGLGLVAALTMCLPPFTYLVLRRIANNTVRPQAKLAAVSIARAISAPGLALGLSSLGFGVLLSFSVLLFEMRGWPNGWLAMTLFSAVFIVLRLAWGHVPDLVGGGRVAGYSLIVQTLGLLTIYFADQPIVAHIGAMLTGAGYSLVFPGLGIEALRRVPAGSAGAAMAFYTAFLDFALGLGLPTLGFFANFLGLTSVFLLAAISSVAAMVLSFRLGAGQDQEVSATSPQDSEA